MKIYYSDRLVLTAHRFVFGFFFSKGLHSFSAEILILHSEVYHLPIAGPLQQVSVNV